MIYSRLSLLVALTSFIFLFTHCSDTEDNDDPLIEIAEESMNEEEVIEMEEENNDMPNDTTEDMGSDDSENTDNDTTDDTPDDGLSERFDFIGNIVIENSWNTGGCGSPPCDTNDEGLDNFFTEGEPNDPYFYIADDESELFLECQQEKGRRIEFKQRSEGPLNSASSMEFTGTYYTIPNGGMTIAQVHNRGGMGNKPFFRLEMHADKLETVIRKDPEVSSSDTTFDKVDYPFLNGEDYDESPLTVVLEKGGGEIRIQVFQNEMVILDQSFQPDSTTRWVTDTGIANGYYLKAGLYNAAVTHTENLILGYSTFKFATED